MEQTLGENDWLIRMPVSQRARQLHAELPSHWQTRMVQTMLDGKPLRFITSMLDAQRFDAQQLVQLYRQRWEIEQGVREIKQSLQQGHSVLRSRQSELVMQEVWGVLIAHTLLRRCMRLMSRPAKENASQGLTDWHWPTGCFFATMGRPMAGPGINKAPGRSFDAAPPQYSKKDMRHPHSLQGIRILSLALNLPGPAALQRCHAMGAICTKMEPPTPDGTGSGDPMALYSPQAYHALHQGIRVLQVHLKTPEGQHQLQQELQTSDVLLTSFRPAALHKLGLDWPALHTRHPRLCMVRILGDARPEAADLPGHDLTYQAEAGLVHSGHMPTSLHADMAGALSASEALLHTLLERERNGLGSLRDVGLAQAAQWLAQPLHWGLTTPQGDVGGAHAGYRVYATADGHVAVAALEPHFAQRLCAAAGIDCDGQAIHMRSPGLHAQLEAFLQQTSGADLACIAAERDIPLHVLPGDHPMGLLENCT